MHPRDKQWAGKRFRKPVERLTTFEEQSGECIYCGSIVKMPRDNETLRLQPNKCWCLLCGQHYFVHPLDLERFLGYPPEAEEKAFNGM
jgi:hypothetical protein